MGMRVWQHVCTLSADCSVYAPVEIEVHKTPFALFRGDSETWQKSFSGLVLLIVWVFLVFAYQQWVGGICFGVGELPVAGDCIWSAHGCPAATW